MSVRSPRASKAIWSSLQYICEAMIPSPTALNTSVVDNMAGTVNVFYRWRHLFVLFAMSLSGTLQTPLDSVGIGAMLSSKNMDSVLQQIAGEINTNSSSFGKPLQFNFSSYVLSENPIRSALDVCEKLVTQRVYAVIVSHPHNMESPPIAISYTCGFYQIPVIGISARESIFSDKVRNFFIIIL